MTRRRLTDTLGTAMVIAGCASWAWVAALEGPVDAAAAASYVDPRNQAPDGMGAFGYGEQELLVLDLRLAPLLLATAGIAVLIAHSARSAGRALAVATAAAVLLELVSVALPDDPARVWVPAVGLAVASAGVVSAARRRGRHNAPAAGPGDASGARVVLAVVGIVLLLSQVVLVGFLPTASWAIDALPRGYVWVIPALRWLLVVAGSAALLLAARRPTWWHAGVGVAAGVSLAPAPDPGPAFLGAALVLVLLVTAAAVAGDYERPLFVRPLGWGLAAAATAPIVVVVAFGLNVGIGAAALELNGGHIDADGLPVFLSGTLAAAVPVAIYLVTATRPEDDRGAGERARPAMPAAR